MRGAGGLLDRYLLRRFASSYGLCALGFLLLFLVMDFFAKLDNLARAEKALAAEGATLWAFVAEYYSTKLPVILTFTGPYLTLFAAIATLLSFGRHNEVMPMLMAGRSVHRVLAPVYAFAGLVVLGLVVAEEYVVPPAARRQEALDRVLRGDARDEIDRVPHLRDAASGNVLSVRTWSPSLQRLSGVSSPAFRDPRGAHPPGRLEAKELLWRVHRGVVGWYPREGVVTPTGPDAQGRMQPPARLPPDRPVAFHLEPAAIDLLVKSGSPGLSRPELSALARRHPLQFDLRMQLHTRTTRPASSFVLLLLGLPFVTGPARRTIAAGLGVALGTCVAYVGVDMFFQQMGNRGELDPLVAAWTAPCLFGAIAVARLDRVPT